LGTHLRSLYEADMSSVLVVALRGSVRAKRLAASGGHGESGGNCLLSGWMGGLTPSGPDQTVQRQVPQDGSFWQGLSVKR
jgi:hypothetical protein